MNSNNRTFVRELNLKNMIFFHSQLGLHNIKESIDGPTPYGSHTPPMHYPGFSSFWLKELNSLHVSLHK